MTHRPARASLLVLLAAALTLVDCNGIGPGRTPSGTTATSRMDAAGVTRLDVAYGFDVRVSLGQPEAVTITYDDNLADLLDVRVDGRTLRFQLQPNSNIDNRPTLRAEVTMSRLEEIRAAGTSTVTVANSSSAPVCGCWSRAAAGWWPTTLPWTGLTPRCRGPPAWSSPARPTPSAPRARAPATSRLTYTGTPQFTKRDTSGGASIQPV